MRKIITGGLLLVLLSCTTKGPVFTLDENQITLGEVNLGDTIDIVYTFTNTGDKDLYIQNVNPACGCTVPFFETKAIFPGEQGEIKLTYVPKPSDVKEDGMGIKKKSVVSTNEDANAFSTLYFTAVVKKQ